MMRSYLITLLATLTALGLGACGDDPAELPPGSLQLSWLVGTGGCEPSGVETIAVYVSEVGSPSSSLELFQCNNGGATISSLTPGVYDISLRGQDTGGVERFGGEELGVEVRSSGTTTVATVRLSALLARVNVSWYFDNGRMCSYNEVSSILISLFEDEYEVYTTTAECGLGAAQVAEVQADTYIIDVVARDSTGVVQFSGQDEVLVDRGDLADIEIRLMPIE